MAGLAERVRQELEAELAVASRRVGTQLEWSAAESAVLDLIDANLRRTEDLRADYEAADEVKLKVKLSTELRLLETAVARLLRQIKTDVPVAPSQTTVKARRAANARWEAVRRAEAQ